MFDSGDASRAARAGALIDRVCASSRTEARAAADRLAAIGALYRLRLAESGETGFWAADTWDEVAGEVAAALRISVGLASSYLRYAQAMVERLPRVGAVFAAGDIDYRLFQTIVFRTDLIEDPAVLAGVDARLAVRAPRWPSMTRGKLAALVDRVVAAVDGDAVRRAARHRVDRDIAIWETEAGMAQIQGSLFGTDAAALDARLDALAATVCECDPRTREQRRADALGALAGGADRLGCRCGGPDCAAGARPVPGPVVIHVIAEQATVDGHGQAPGATIGAPDLIPAELIAELAASATARAVLIPPVDAAPEPRYVPSAGLADFVRCRDLTCRAPGCDRPAVFCDIDHTVPYGQGGATHASNLKCLCRMHHLLKTFWGWKDQQLPDATVIWTMPTGHSYVTNPGSALLFPTLCAPTGDLPAPHEQTDRCGDRTVMMPTRARTRAQNRTQAITAERHQNHKARQARERRREDAHFPNAPADPNDPPPF
jgi:hypothetical protein